MSRKTEIYLFMSRKLNYLLAISNEGEGKAQLAALRRGIGQTPGEFPEIFGILLQDMPEEFMSEGEKVSKEEWACYIALTLFALHQQGNDGKTASMNTDKKVSVGLAMNDYVMSSNDSNARSRMAVKLQTLASSKDMNEFSYHLRAVIKLLKTKGIQLNYSMLAADLYEFQFQENKANIFLKWGQDFYRSKKSDRKEEENENE